jgi:hypothetical protein
MFKSFFKFSKKIHEEYVWTCILKFFKNVEQMKAYKRHGCASF